MLRAGVLRPSVLGPSRLGSALSSNTQNATSTNDAQDGGASASGGSDGGGDKKEDEANDKASSSNPFLKDIKDDEEPETTVKVADNNKGTDNEDIDERADPLTLLRKNGMERANLFAAAKSSIPLVEKSGFVFGQNLHERVVGVSRTNKFVNLGTIVLIIYRKILSLINRHRRTMTNRHRLQVICSFRV